MPWQLGPLGSNPGDFWLVGECLLGTYTIKVLNRFLMIEVQEEDDRLIEVLCSTDDKDRAREALANMKALRATINHPMQERVARIPEYIFDSEEAVERLKEPMGSAGPGQDWYARINTEDRADGGANVEIRPTIIE
jgi:hypothetical protein